MRAILLAILLMLLVIITVAVPILIAPSHLKSLTDPEVSEVWDKTKRLYKIDVRGLKILQQGPFTVYFPPQYELQAEEVVQTLRKGWEVVKRRLGLDLGAFSVVLVLLREDMGGVFIERWEEEGPVPWPLVSSMRWQSLPEAPPYVRESVYLDFPHEAAHTVLEFEGRWLEEGLAEYIGYVVSQELDPEMHRHLLEMTHSYVQELSLQTTTYDLTTQPPYVFTFKDGMRIKELSPEELAGYGVSLAFWLQIAQQHGEEVIRQFLEQIRQLQQPSEQDLAYILSKLTGEDIWMKLQKMNLQEVLQTLEQAIDASTQR